MLICFNSTCSKTVLYDVTEIEELQMYICMVAFTIDENQMCSLSCIDDVCAENNSDIYIVKINIWCLK